MPTTKNPSNQTILQYNTQSGSTSNLNDNISPGTLGQVLTSNGVSSQATYQNAPSSAAFSSINMQVFSTTGSHTYTPTSNMKYCVVEVLGAGGGGGNASSIGSGGGAGGYARQTFDVATIGASQSITIGTGGTAAVSGGSTTFGALITCTGGAGGVASAVQNSPIAGGAGGTATVGGTVTAVGGKGENGMWINLNVQFPGSGGDSFLAPGGHSGKVASASGGAGQYGSGGGGAYSSGTGGAGGDGLVLVTEFISP